MLFTACRVDIVLDLAIDISAVLPARLSSLLLLLYRNPAIMHLLPCVVYNKMAAGHAQYSVDFLPDCYEAWFSGTTQRKLSFLAAGLKHESEP